MTKFKLAPALAAGLALAAVAMPAQAHVRGGAVESANIQPSNGHNLDSAGVTRVYRDLRTEGFNAVTINIPLLQPDKNVPRIIARKPGPGWSATPTDAQLRSSIRHARAQHLNVILKPQLVLAGGEWAAHIKGSAAEQKAWTAWLVHYAKLGRSEGVTTLILGVELKGMTLTKGSAARWAGTIAAVHKVAPKLRLTYAPHTNDELLLLPRSMVSRLAFLEPTWYPRPPKGPLTVKTLEADMRKDKGRYFDKACRRYHHKHLIFAETGFRSVKIKSYYLKSSQVGAADVDLNLQRMQFEAMLHFLDGVSYVDGVTLYRVDANPAAGGPRDPWFTWQGKPSEAVIARYFGGRV